MDYAYSIGGLPGGMNVAHNGETPFLASLGGAVGGFLTRLFLAVLAGLSLTGITLFVGFEELWLTKIFLLVFGLIFILAGALIVFALPGILAYIAFQIYKIILRYESTFIQEPDNV